MARLIHGIGINDADYAVHPTVNGKRQKCPIYFTWAAMITRCYDENYLNRNPSYRGCSVVEEWHRFSNFREWYLTQGDVRGKQLDKDILYPGNKVYSPETCVFVTHELNTLFTKANRIRGKYPIGVTLKTDCKRNKKYESHIAKHGKVITLGYHYTPEEAHQAYVQAKIEHIQTYHMPKQTDKRIIEGLNRWIEVLRNGEYELV